MVFYHSNRNVSNTAATVLHSTGLQGQGGLLEVRSNGPFVDLVLLNLSDRQPYFLLKHSLSAFPFCLPLIMIMAPKANCRGLITPEVFYCKE